MGYVWSELTGGYSGSFETKSPRVLNIDAKKLMPKKNYTFQVLAYMMSAPNISNTATLQVFVEEQPVVAGISNGATSTSGTDNYLVMDGSATYDPDNSSEPFVYDWSCVDDSGSDCGVTLDAAVTTNISAGSLSAGTYTFSLFVEKGDRNDTATATVIMMAGSVPKVTIGSLDSGKYNSIDGSYVELAGSSKGVTYEWSLIDADTSISSVLLGGATARSTVTVDVSALTAGTTYTFRLTGTDSSGSAGYSELELVVNDSPASGSLDVSPENGETINA